MSRLKGLLLGLGQIGLVAGLVSLPIGFGFWSAEMEERRPQEADRPEVIARLATLTSDFDRFCQAYALLSDGSPIVVRGGKDVRRPLKGQEVMVGYSTSDESWELLATGRRSHRYHSERFHPGWRRRTWGEQPHDSAAQAEPKSPREFVSQPG